MCDIEKTLIIDPGSYITKAGFSDDQLPRCLIPTIIGSPKKFDCRNIWTNQKNYFGEEAIQKSGLLKINQIIEKGKITNIDDFNDFIQYIFHQELRVDPENQSVLLTRSPFETTKPEQLMQTMFETFIVESFDYQLANLMSLYNSNNMTGVVLDSGHELTSIVPIIDGEIQHHAIKKSYIAGKELTKFLCRMIGENCMCIVYDNELGIINDIKETCSFIPVSEEEKNFEFNYKTPDGNHVFISKEAYECPELMFNPEISNFDDDGIAQMLISSINSCAENMHNRLFSNIVISGGNTMIKGFDERLFDEIKSLAPKSVDIRFNSTENKRYSSFAGSVVYSSLPQFAKSSVTRKQYHEIGPFIQNQENTIII